VPSKIAEAFRDVNFGLKIPRLLASREEAEGIMAVIPQGTGLKALGFEASRGTVARKDLDQYRIVHFATHGVLDNENPELSGIVLSLFDQEGRPEDGFLRLHDIYNLNLPVDLVVLSACNTGLGKDVKGEGLIGLTRGFMYAGAAGVVASLWKVDDDATAELMRHFYEALFKKGMSPSEALRESQLAMRRQPRWHAPYYWAGFVLQGQYDQKESMTGASLRIRERLTELIIITGVLTGAAFLVLRRRRKGAK
jgi:CHAT domain-containing protein